MQWWEAQSQPLTQLNRNRLRSRCNTEAGSLKTMQFYDAAPSHDLTYSDVFLVPSRSDVASRLDVSLATDDGTGATIPLVSANMNSVTGARLAATMARRGGLGVLPQDMHLQDLDAAIRWVKDQPTIFDTQLELTPDSKVADALRLIPPLSGQGIVLRSADGEYVGCLEASALGLGQAAIHGQPHIQIRHIGLRDQDRGPGIDLR